MVAAVTLAVFAFVGCASTRAPVGWVERPGEVQSGFNGAWAEVHMISPEGSTLAGELIAVSGDTLFLANTKLHAVARANVKSARVVWYDSDTAGMMGAVFLGTVLTIFNGWWLVVTAPMWLIGGIIATATREDDSIVRYPSQGWDRLARFARYPQGVPAVVDRSRIRMIPYRLLPRDLRGADEASEHTRSGPAGSDTD